jgi:hypothetical protein
MKKLNIAVFIMWLIAGLFVIITNEVTIFEYILLWITCMLSLVSKIIEK